MRASLLLAAAVAVSATCTMICGPDTASCNACTSPPCTNVVNTTTYTLDFDRVGLCSPGYFPTTYPLCADLPIITSRPLSYTCTKNIDEIRDSRVLQFAARQLRLPYAVSPLLSECKHSCADVDLTPGQPDPHLNALCGDCVPSGSMVIGRTEVVNIRIPASSDGRSAAVYGASSFPNVHISLLQSRNAVVAEDTYSARRVYVCRSSSSRGSRACLRELDARGLIDRDLSCFDGTNSVPCPDGGSKREGIEWAGRIVGGVGTLLLIVSLHWWLVPIVQLIPVLYTWCNDQSPVLRALHEGLDIILLKWDYTSACPMGVTSTGCHVINVAISSGVVLFAALGIAVLTHLISWCAAGSTVSDPNVPPRGGLVGALSAQSFRLTLGGALTLWLYVSMVPMAHYASGVVFNDVHGDYEKGGWWIFALLGVGFLVLVLVATLLGCAFSFTVAHRISREVRGLPHSTNESAPVVAQTPYGEVVSASGGYSPLYRALVSHVHGPSSLVSATAALWNSAWWNWFPTNDPLAWAKHEGLYDGDSLLVTQMGPLYNSFNPSNIIFGTFSWWCCVVIAVICGIECIYENASLNCCVVRCALSSAAMLLIAGVYLIRRPLLGDNLLPALLLIVAAALHVFYLIIQASDDGDSVSAQIALVCLTYIVFGLAILIGFLHGFIRFVHCISADGSPIPVTTVAVDMGERKEAGPLPADDAGAHGLVAVPTFYGSPGHVAAADPKSPPVYPLGESINGQQVYYPSPQQVQQPLAPELPADGNWMYTGGDEWPVESSYTIVTQ